MWILLGFPEKSILPKLLTKGVPGTSGKTISSRACSKTAKTQANNNLNLNKIFFSHFDRSIC